MSNDLLTIVSTIKQLEQERKQYQELQSHNDELDEEIIRARLPVDQAQQALHELEERRRTGRPQLEARLQRLENLRERLAVLLHIRCLLAVLRHDGSSPIRVREWPCEEGCQRLPHDLHDQRGVD